MKRRFNQSFALAVVIWSLAANTALAQQFTGIGAVLASATNGARIMDVLPGSPAAASGQIHRGNVIIALAQGEASAVSIKDMKLAEVVNLVRGPEDSVVRVTLIPAGKTEAEATEVRLTRSVLKVPNPPSNANVRRIVPRQTSWRSRVFHLSWSTLILIGSGALLVIAGVIWSKNR